MTKSAVVLAECGAGRDHAQHVAFAQLTSYHNSGDLDKLAHGLRVFLWGPRYRTLDRPVAYGSVQPKKTVNQLETYWHVQYSLEPDTWSHWRTWIDSA